MCQIKTLVIVSDRNPQRPSPEAIRDMLSAALDKRPHYPAPYTPSENDGMLCHLGPSDRSKLTPGLADRLAQMSPDEIVGVIIHETPSKTSTKLLRAADVAARSLFNCIQIELADASLIVL
jgi:hypothetical protein